MEQDKKYESLNQFCKSMTIWGREHERGKSKAIHTHHQFQFPELGTLFFFFSQGNIYFLKSSLSDISHRGKPSPGTSECRCTTEVHVPFQA